MALSKKTLFENLNTRISQELIDYQAICASKEGPENFKEMIATHARNLATIISDEVDDFVRSAEIKPEQMYIQAGAFQTSGGGIMTQGPLADKTPLMKDPDTVNGLTLDDMN